MSSTPSQYRRILYVDDRTLESRELNSLQDMIEKFRLYGAGEVFADGTPLNITATPSGSSLILSATNGSYPMMVFMDGRFEAVAPLTLSYSPSQTSGYSYVYLNWALTIITSVQDPTLVDSNGAATANMGELDLALSATDTSGVALDSETQYSKNTVPIVVFTLARGAGGSITVQIPPLMQPWMAANETAFGAVQTTTNTCSGVVPGTDDPRMSNARNPNALSVTDAAVAPVVPTGSNVTLFTNADSSTDTGAGIYAVTAEQETGGITTDKLIYTTLNVSGTTILDWIRTKINYLYTTWSGHIGVALGSSATHPMPTASQVGATPASHQGLALGLPTSHPPTVTSDTSGFVVQSNVTTPTIYAASIQPASGGTPRGAITYDGDFLSNPSAAYTVNSQLTGGLFSGILDRMSKIAHALTDHVNQTSNANPHGLTLADLGGTTTSYVDTSSANALASAEANTTTVCATTLASAEAYANQGLAIIDTGIVSDGGTVTVPSGYEIAKCELVLNIATLLTVRFTNGWDDDATINTSYTKNTGSNTFTVRCYWQTGETGQPPQVGGSAYYIMLGSQR